MPGKSKTPTLDTLIASGNVWIEDGEYVGKAADGTVVAFGATFAPEQTERYLSARPDPKQW